MEGSDVMGGVPESVSSPRLLELKSATVEELSELIAKAILWMISVSIVFVSEVCIPCFVCVGTLENRHFRDIAICPSLCRIREERNVICPRAKEQ